jgi:hypothetical protein
MARHTIVRAGRSVVEPALSGSCQQRLQPFDGHGGPKPGLCEAFQDPEREVPIGGFTVLRGDAEHAHSGLIGEVRELQRSVVDQVVLQEEDVALRIKRLEDADAVTLKALERHVQRPGGALRKLAEIGGTGDKDIDIV